MFSIGGDFDVIASAITESPVKYLSYYSWHLTASRNPAARHCMVGSLTGAVASQRVTEACEGRLRAVRNRS